MAANRPMRPVRRRPQQQGFTLGSGRGHEFQNDQPHDLPLTALEQTPRNIFEKTIRRYRDFDDDGGMGRHAMFSQMNFPYTTAAQLLLPQTDRGYLLIQNLDAAANVYLGFGFSPTAGIGLKLAPGVSYEPYVIPQNDIFIIGDATGSVTVLYAA